MLSAVFKLGRVIAIGVAMAVPGLPALADLTAPTGPVLLRVSGALDQTNVGSEAHFDLDMLGALGVETVVTTTIWTDGEQTFEAVPLHALLEAIGAGSGTLRATAVNDYSVEIPIDDAVPGGAMLAFSRNGRTMSVRDKGPLWLIYPYDTNPDYQSETHYARSIWQLDRLEITN